MRNVNIHGCFTIFSITSCFILTMRNVNLFKQFEEVLNKNCFILTMRNVNMLKKHIHIDLEEVLY